MKNSKLVVILAILSIQGLGFAYNAFGDLPLPVVEPNPGDTDEFEYSEEDDDVGFDEV
ncbi:MAG: hypothetical protein LBB20_02015 [Puniceicoccales bacterium]|jgi:hypothetical protein|nr:hypothetical protein [Puniceicoccales bacterium]